MSSTWSTWSEGEERGGEGGDGASLCAPHWRVQRAISPRRAALLTHDLQHRRHDARAHVLCRDNAAEWRHLHPCFPRVLRNLVDPVREEGGGEAPQLRDVERRGWRGRNRTVKNGGFFGDVLERRCDERSNLIQGGSTGARRKTCDGLDEFTASWWVTHKRVDLVT